MLEIHQPNSFICKSHNPSNCHLFGAKTVLAMADAHEVPYIAHYEHNKNQQYNICCTVIVQANRLHNEKCLCSSYRVIKSTNILRCSILSHNTES